MSAISKSIVNPPVQPADNSVNFLFFKFLPKVKTHAAIQFRKLRKQDREEAIAEATAMAFLNIHAAFANGKAHRLNASSTARFAVLRVQDGGHVGGSSDGRCDVMSPKAQRLHGFNVIRVGHANAPVYDCMTDPSGPVWKQVLHADRWTDPADQAAFRVDLGRFLAQQSDRTRTLLGMLGAGHKQIEVADRLGTTPAAVCHPSTV